MNSTQYIGHFLSIKPFHLSLARFLGYFFMVNNLQLYIFKSEEFIQIIISKCSQECVANLSCFELRILNFD